MAVITPGFGAPTNQLLSLGLRGGASQLLGAAAFANPFTLLGGAGLSALLNNVFSQSVSPKQRAGLANEQFRLGQASLAAGTPGRGANLGRLAGNQQIEQALIQGTRAREGGVGSLLNPALLQRTQGFTFDPSDRVTVGIGSALRGPTGRRAQDLGRERETQLRLRLAEGR